MLKDAGYEQQGPLMMFTDSANARAVALNPLNTARTYHIDLRLKWIIQRLAIGEFQLQHVGTNDIVADGFTKALNATARGRQPSADPIAISPTPWLGTGPSGAMFWP
jgi:hypothetical protein